MSSSIVAQPLTRALLRWLLARRETVAPLDPATDRAELGYGKPFCVVAVLLTVLSTALMSLGLVGGQGDPKAMTIFMLIFGTMWAASIWALHETFFVSIQVSRDGLFRRIRNGRELHIPWISVTSVTYSEAMNWLVFRAKGRGVIRVSIFRNGLTTLASLAEEHLSGEAARPAAALLQEASPAGSQIQGEP